MTYKAIQDRVMFQTNNDVSDLGDFKPALGDYINLGYDELVYAYSGNHVMTGSTEYPPLSTSNDVPNLPEYAHNAIADYATYMVYRNGNAIKQQRGEAFYSTFMKAQADLKYERVPSSSRQFTNLY